MKKQSSFWIICILSGLLLSSCDKSDDPQGNGGGNTIPLTITGITPGSGTEGTRVVITGTGFSASIQGNVVKFGSVAAAVDSATVTRLVTKVPKNAASGKVTVEVGGKTVTSASDFSVTGNTTVFGSLNGSLNITATSAGVTSTIVARGDGTITQHGHVWSKTSNAPTLTDNKTELGPVSAGASFPYTFSSELKGLEAAVSYFVRSYLTVGGLTAYGEVFQLKTLVAADPNAPETVYVAGLDYLYALDAVSGGEKWKRGISGTASHVLFDQGMVYVGTSQGVLYAFNADAGAKKWELSLNNQETFNTSPIIDNGTIYIASNGDKSTLYAFNAGSGVKKWEIKLEENVTNPTLVNGVLYVGAGKYLYGIDAASGIKKWTYTGISGWSSSPAVVDNVLYASHANGYFYAIDVSSGAKKWEYKTTEFYPGSSPTVLNGIAYMGGSDKKMYAFDARTGAKKWEFLTQDKIVSSPFAGNGMVYVASLDKKLYALDASTGSKKWEYEIGSTNSMTSGNTIMSGGIVFVSGGNKKFYAFEAGTGTLKWSYTGSNSFTGACVVTKDGKAYFSADSGMQQ